MAAVKIPTSADIYLEVNGVRVAVVQSYKVTATRSSKAIYAFGQEAPVATIRGQGQYRLELNQSNVSKEQAIKNIAAAIDNMRGDQKDKLQAIVAVLNSTNTTLEKQLNVIAGAMQSMSIDLRPKPGCR